MLKSNAPVPYTIPWANAGTKNTIPVASQIGITNGAASFTDGYPPLTFTPIASGGVPPFGADTNGILYDETLNTLWQQAGFMYAYSSTFSTNQGGYPAQSLLMRSDGKGLWLNLADSNTTNPDATGAANWTAVRANIGSSTISVIAGTNTPDPSALGPRLLIITGSLSSAATLVLPLTAGASWLIYNATTGTGTLGVQGATGSGVTVAQSTVVEVVTDGTNYYTSNFNGAGVYLPINGTAVAASKLATARTIAMTGDVSWTSPAFDGTANVTAAGTIATGAVTLAKMASFQANSLMGNPTGSTATPSAITLASPLTFSGSTLALSYQPVNKAGDTMTGQLNGTSIGLSGSLSASGATITGASSSAYAAYDVLNPSGVHVQLSANGNSEGEVRTTTNHPLNLMVNNVGVLNLTTSGVAQFTNQIDVSSHGVNTANVVLQPPASSTIGGSITFNHVNGDQWCAYPTAGQFNVGYTTGGGGPNPKLTLTTAGNLTTTGTIQPGSDTRVKANQTKIENALDTVRHYLVGNTYNRRDNRGAFQAGFIADKVQEGLPHLVSESETPFNGYERFKTMDYNGAEAYLANAITELHDIVIAQAKRIESLEGGA